MFDFRTALVGNVIALDDELAARRALSATEVTFAAYGPARKRGRVDLPLTIDGKPLETLVESGDLQPEPPEPAEDG